MLDPYCYKDSNVLINKLNIRDSSKLDIAEVEFSCNAIHELSIAPIRC